MDLNNIFIYSPKVNGTELLRTLSLNGKNAFNLRIFNLVDLLETTNNKLDFPVNTNLLSNSEIEDRVIGFFLDKISLKNVSYQDVIHFISTLNNVRMHITDNDESKAINKIVLSNKENTSLILLNEFYDAYLKSLGEDVDTILYIEKIIKCFKNKNYVFGTIYYFDEDNLSPLELKLLNTISKNVVSISVLDLFDKKPMMDIKSIMPRYGIRNEVAHVIKDIAKNNYSQDECQIVLLNKSGYTNELFKFMSSFKMNTTFGCGLPINISDPYKLLTSLNQLEKKYFYDVNGYLNLFSSESINLEKLGVTHVNQVAQLLGRMKICFDRNTNDLYLQKFNYVKANHSKEFDLFMEKIDREISRNKEEILNETYRVIEEFSRGKSYIIKEYSKDNNGYEKLYNASIEFITKVLDTADSSLIPDVLKESYLKKIDSKYLCYESFNDESIHVSDISNALTSLRKHVYIIGMNSAYYPGSLTEDFLFSDNLYEQLCGIPNITEKGLNEKNEYLKAVINSYLSLGTELSLSYNAQEIKEVRELNPCSVLLNFADEFFKEQNIENKKNHKPDALSQLKEECSFYDDELSELYEVSNIVINNNDIARQDIDVAQEYSDLNCYGQKMIDASYSPSALPKFIKCPFKFYLDNILRVDNEIIYDPLRPIQGNRFGDLLHYVMEHFVKEEPNASKNDVKAYAENLYDLYVSIDRSLGDDNLQKKDFVNSAENAYIYLVNNFILPNSQTEYGFGGEKAKFGKIHFGGSIDLVTKDKENNVVVVDYKTGLSIEHQNNDVDSCIQGLIYAQAYEKMSGKKPTKLVFFYTRLNKEVVFDKPCSEEAKQLVLERTKLFEDAIINKHFGIALEEDRNERNGPCKYCKYANICKKDA